MSNNTNSVPSTADRRNDSGQDANAFRVVIDYTGALLDVNGGFDDALAFQVFRDEDSAWFAIMAAAERFDREYCEFDTLSLADIEELTAEARRLEHQLLRRVDAMADTDGMPF